MTVKTGDSIKCKGKTVVISEIIDAYYHIIDGWMIEGIDQNGKYFMWKQWADGGELIEKR